MNGKQLGKAQQWTAVTSLTEGKVYAPLSKNSSYSQTIKAADQRLSSKAVIRGPV